MGLGFEIRIHAGPDVASSSVSASGSVLHIITDAERTAFEIEDEGLKAAVAQFHGKAPSDAWVHKPAGKDDLYKTYRWDEVQTVLDVQSATILEITSQPVIVAEKKFVNNYHETAQFDAAISDQVQTTATTNWSTSTTLGVEEKIKIGFEFLGAGGGTETTFSFSGTFGQGGSDSRQTTVGSTSGLHVPVAPGSGVKAQLTASRGVMRIRVIYRVWLRGYVATNYYPPYNGHYYWALPIGSVLGAGKLAQTRLVTEDIEIGYYSNSRIELMDLEGRMLTTLGLGAIGAAPAEELVPSG